MAKFFVQWTIEVEADDAIIAAYVACGEMVGGPAGDVTVIAQDGDMTKVDFSPAMSWAVHRRLSEDFAKLFLA
jgi:hypothetical protein